MLNINAIKETLRTKYSGTVKVGVLHGEKYPNGTNVAAVGVFQNFGTHNIAPRPFLEPAIRNMSIAKEDIENLDNLGNKAVNAVKGTITELGIVRTGTLRDSISYEVTK